MFETLTEVKEANRGNGYTFFTKKRLRDLGTTIYPTLYGGKYFIAENVLKIYIGNNRYTSGKVSSIYKARKDGACDIYNGECFPSHSQATNYINNFLIDEEEETTGDQYDQ